MYKHKEKNELCQHQNGLEYKHVTTTSTIYNLKRNQAIIFKRPILERGTQINEDLLNDKNMEIRKQSRVNYCKFIRLFYKSNQKPRFALLYTFADRRISSFLLLVHRICLVKLHRLFFSFSICLIPSISVILIRPIGVFSNLDFWVLFSLEDQSIQTHNQKLSC